MRRLLGSLCAVLGVAALVCAPSVASARPAPRASRHAADAPTGRDAGTFNPVTPARVLDTRSGRGGTAPGAGGVVAVTVGGTSGVPASGVSAVALTVTETGATRGGFVTVWAAGQPRPATSNLNFTAGQTVPNSVVTAPGADGKINLYNGSSAKIQLVVDVSGYYVTGSPSDAGAFMPVQPARILDTRHDMGVAPLRHVYARLTVDGVGGVPQSGVSAVALNVTVTQPDQDGYLTVYSGDSYRPAASSVNYAAGQTVANLVIVPVSTDGQIVFYNGSGGNIALIADVAGWFAAGTAGKGGTFHSLMATRVLDTRKDSGGPTPGANSPVALQISGEGGVAPLGVSAVVLNVTVTEPAAGGYITAYADGQSRPTASSLNFVAGQTVADLVTVPVGSDGKIDLFNGSAGSTPLVADVEGYYRSDMWEPELPDTRDDLLLNAVSCVSTTHCVAAGQNDHAVVAATLSDRDWTVEQLSAPAGTGRLDGVSCVATTQCVAVGVVHTTDKGDVPIVETYDGSSWTLSTPALPAGFQGRLTGVSCAASTTTCVAVGQLVADDGTAQGAYVFLSDSVPTMTSIGTLAGSAGSRLDAVSCPSKNACVAVGSAIGADDSFQPLVVQFSGNYPIPSVVGVNGTRLANAELSGVSCPAVDVCRTVGYTTNDGADFSRDDASFESIAGSADGVGDRTPTTIVGTSGNEMLVSVSCASAEACTAIGQTGSRSQLSRHDGSGTPLSDSIGTSGSWVADFPPLDTGAPGGAADAQGTLSSVSCVSAEHCTAVGLTNNGEGGATVFATVRDVAGGS